MGVSRISSKGRLNQTRGRFFGKYIQLHKSFEILANCAAMNLKSTHYGFCGSCLDWDIFKSRWGNLIFLPHQRVIFCLAAGGVCCQHLTKVIYFYINLISPYISCAVFLFFSSKDLEDLNQSFMKFLVKNPPLIFDF